MQHNWLNCIVIQEVPALGTEIITQKAFKFEIWLAKLEVKIRSGKKTSFTLRMCIVSSLLLHDMFHKETLRHHRLSRGQLKSTQEYSSKLRSWYLNCI